jgi:hypothetical protein
MLRPPCMDDQQPFSWIIGQQMLQQQRKLLLPQLGTDVVVGAPRRRGDRAIDMHFTMVIPSRRLRHVLDHSPRHRQCRVAPHGRLIHKDQRVVLRPLGQRLFQLSPKGRLLLGLRLQMAVGQSTQAKAQLVQQLAHPLPPVREPQAGGDEMPDQFGGPHIRVLARLSWTAAGGIFDLHPLLRGESRGAPRDRHPLQPAEAGLIERVNPGANGLFIAVELLGDLKAVFTIHPQQDAVIAFAQPHIRGAAESRPYLFSRHSHLRNDQHVQVLPPRTFLCIYHQCLKNRDYLLDHCRIVLLRTDSLTLSEIAEHSSS